METLLGLATLAGASGGLLYAANRADQERRYSREVKTVQKQEGFQPLINPTVDSILPDDQRRLITESSARFNPLVNIINTAQNPLLPPNYTPSDVRAAQAKVTGAVRKAIAKPADPSYSILMDTKPSFGVGGGTGTLQKDIQKCETVKSIDCEKLKEPSFGTNCGICLDGGKDSKGKAMLGGLYVTPEDISVAETNANRMRSKVSYQPTLGSCAPGKFAVTYEQCVRIKNQQECERNQTFNDKGCNQCAQDNRFYYVDPNVQKESLTFTLIGSGQGQIIVSGAGSTIPISLSGSPQNFTVNANEGSVVTVNISAPSGATEASVAGFASGPVGVNGNGSFQIDIGRLAERDLVANGKPRIAGFYAINGTTYSAIRSGRGRTSMSLQLFIPYTFFDPTDTDTQQCSGAPFITKQVSAEKLNSGTCFKKGSGPGNYSLECLQETFFNNGCTNEGQGYPSDSAKAQALMVDKQGNPLSIGAISQSIYEKSVKGETGKDLNGNDLTVTEWDSSSYFCTGKRVRNECDTVNKTSGPLSAGCIAYLYKNGGAQSSDIGATYTSGTSRASLGATGDQFCTPNGTISPISPTGAYNEANVLTARAKGGLDAVKKFYNDIHKKANDNSLPDSARAEAIKQCYGIDLGSAPTNELPVANRSKTAEKPEVFYVNGPGGPGRPGNHAYSALRSEANEICSSYGARVATYAELVDAQQNGANWCATGWVADRADASFPINEDVRGGCADRPGIQTWSPPVSWFREVGLTNNTGQPLAGVNCYGVKPPSGFPANMKIPPFNTKRWNQDPYVENVLDSKEGRQFSARQQGINYQRIPANNSVFVLGPLGMGPWGSGGYWTGNTPLNFGTQWIWSEPNAERSAQAFVHYVFTAYVTNPLPKAQTVTIYTSVDNVGNVFINNTSRSGGAFNGFKTFTFSLPPGESQVEVIGINEGGPAAMFLLMLGSNGQPLLKTDATWKWRRNN